jgi:hypothetical protein
MISGTGSQLKLREEVEAMKGLIFEHTKKSRE